MLAGSHEPSFRSCITNDGRSEVACTRYYQATQDAPGATIWSLSRRARPVEQRMINSLLRMLQ